MLKRFRNLDWSLIAPSFLLAGFGLFSLYSSSIVRNDYSNFEKQLAFFITGIVLMFFSSFFNWKTLKENSSLILGIYFICLIALLGVLFLAPTVRGVRTWYKIGSFSLDPIEFTKIVLIVLLAKYFSSRHVELYQIRHILISGAYVFVPAILILLEPEVGSVIVLALVWFK